MASNRDKHPDRARLNRRDLLKLGVAGGLASAVYSLPFLRRNAYAGLRPDAPAKRVLVLYFGGGIRSSTAFHASPSTRRYNPWGAIEGTNTPFSLGKLLDDYLPAGTPIAAPETPLADAAYQLDPMGPWGGLQVPRLREMASSFSVVGDWNNERGDHYRSAVEESTGSTTGAEGGLLTRIGAGIAQSHAMTMGGAPDVPTFHIQPGAAFGNATDALLRHIPVPVFGVAGLPGHAELDDTESLRIGHDWARDDAMRERLDNRRFNSRVGYGRAVVEVYRGDHTAQRHIGEQLAQPWFDINSNPEATQGTVRTATGTVPLTNAMLREVFVRALGPDPNGGMGVGAYRNPDDSEFYRAATDVALALRLLQFGSPAAVVEMGGFDTHSGERRDAPRRFRFLGRLWATLNWLLARIPEPGEMGASMLDRTLIVTMSEFGRDAGTEATGFNNGEGSDHGNDPSCYYLAHAVMGGGVVPGRLVGGAPASTYVPASADRIPPRRLLATLLWALGLDPQDPDWGFPDAPPVTQLFTM